MDKENKTRDEAREEAHTEVIEESFGLTDAEKERRERIAQRAYEIYLSREGSFGDEQTDWFLAEAEIRAALGSPEQDQPKSTPDVAGLRPSVSSESRKGRKPKSSS
jgi:hypothetical protein